MGESIQRREAFEDPHGIVGGEHRDGGAQADTLGARGDRGQHHLGRGDGEVGAVVLPHPEEVDAEAIGERRLIDHVPNRLRGGQQLAVRAPRDVAEGVQPELDGHVSPFVCD